jgi:capsular exopolysaccharide synthesis family protein
MQNMQNELLVEQEEAIREDVFFKKVLNRLLILWPWLIISVAGCVIFSYLYLRTQTPEYRIHASILVKGDKNGSDGGDMSVLQDFGLVLGKSNVDNEVEIFKSYTLMKSVVENQQLFIRYYVPGKLKESEIFLKRPITLRYIDSYSDTSKNYGKYKIVYNQKQGATCTLFTNDKSYKVELGDTLALPNGRIVITASDGFNNWAPGQQLTIIAVPVDNAVREYMGRLNVAIPNKQVSIINLMLNDAVPRKGEIVLDALISTYLQASLNDRNQIADSTIRFIDERLRLVFGELSGIEREIEGFKTTNKLADISEQARLLLENKSEYSKQLTTQEVQLSVVEALEIFLKDNQNETRVVPSSLVMQDPSFVALIQRYNEVQLLRDRMLMSRNAQHLSVITVDEQLKNIRADLFSSISSIKRGIKVGVTELQKRTTGFESQISKIPAKERIWLDYSRQQAIKQELYLFLLKKREETAISKSSTLANARVIDFSKADASPFKPQGKNFLVIGFIIGLIIPFGIYFIKELLNNKVNSLENIASATSTPILAEIGHNSENSDVAVTFNSRSLISEQFRSLRTNINFLLANEKDKVILFTSSMGGEGKSFLSINLASAFALAGKKVIVLELDLRKPKISESLKLRKQGITNFLIERDDNWKKWIQSFGEEKSFDVLSSGPLPPNPAELLMLPKLASLIEGLKEEYDYIIMDSAPVGLVTDAQILSSQADLTLYVVRHGLTFKQQIKLIDMLYRKKSLPRLNIVVNDVIIKKVGYGYDGYGYGYGVYGES